MSRLNSRFLYGSTYDPNARQAGSVFSQNPTGVAGQAASFAAAEQSRLATLQQREADARNAAIAQQQQVAQEATAAQGRDQAARAEALQEQNTRLDEARFNQQLAFDKQKNQEQLAFQAAEQQYQQNQAAAGQRGQAEAAKAQIRQNEYSQYGSGRPIFTNSLNDSAANFFDARLRGGYTGGIPDFTMIGPSRSDNYYDALRSARSNGVSARDAARQAASVSSFSGYGNQQR